MKKHEKKKVEEYQSADIHELETIAKRILTEHKKAFEVLAQGEEK